jgi:hypothetical protein
VGDESELGDVDSGLSVWVVVSVGVVGLALLAYPLWWVLDSALSSVGVNPPVVATSSQPPSTLASSTPVNLALGKPVTGTGPGSDPPIWAIDGDLDTSWNSGSWPPQLLEIDLMEPSAVHSIRLLVGQYPAGDTEHVVFGFRPGDSQPEVLHVFEGLTTDRQWLTHTPEQPWEGLDRIGVGTLVSPS